MTLEERLAAHLEGSWTPYIGKPAQTVYRERLAAVRASEPDLTPAEVRKAVQYVEEIVMPVVPEIEKTVIPKGREPKLHEIMRVISEETRIGVLDIMSPRRFAPTVRARMIYYYAAKHFTSKSIVAIGRDCGGRDHSTVLTGIAKVTHRRDLYEPELSAVIARLQPVVSDIGDIETAPELCNE